MDVEFAKSFVKDIKNITDKDLLKRIKTVILEIEVATALLDLTNVKYIVNSKSYYRIRVGDYRLGLKYENNIVKLIRCLNRKEIYKKFP